MKRSCSVYDIISDDLITRTLVADVGIESKLLSWQIEDFTKKGDNYASYVTSLLVNYQKGKKNYQNSYIAKINPQRPVSSFTQMLEGSYKREMIPIKAPKPYTRSFEKGREVLVIEDLRKKGFSMHERTKGFDLKHSILVVEELARFHASSLLFEETLEKKSIPESFDHFEVWLDNNEICSFFNVIIGSQCISTIKLLKNFPKYEKCITWLEKRMDCLAQLYRDVLSPSRSFNVLIHGDCRASNILFRNDEIGSPQDVRFVDFQGTRKSSPSNDLIYFLFSSVDSHVRRQDIQIIENAYYESFCKVLYAAGEQPPFTLKELRLDMKERKVFGMLSGILILPVSLAEGDEIWDLESLCNNTLKDFVKNQKDKFSQLVMRDGPFKNRFLSIFDEMIESGVCDEN
ncbi:hypothetical protein Anas_06459 [Armadillidium nasatum]|uniref:CHK kinase-like domain-containing protein n=1 Tax=Armadillidium nasatum TaxID=96803 RepID=A0A5N5TNQ5_9CRUS|nr:hypothetical protein Anas_06459 [Armadillidium nasatum]